MDLLVDTSAWVEYLRRTGSRADRTLTRWLTSPGSELFITAPVAMELLAGAGRAVPQIERMVAGLPHVAIDGERDFADAATLYRAARAVGKTPRSLVDCLIAAIALRTGVTLAHRDADFDVLASCTGLHVVSLA